MNLVDLLLRRARESAGSVAYTFLANGEVESACLTYRDLDLRARAIAAELQRWAAPGDRAMLLYPSGLDFIAALFGCFYSGVVAVPAYPPQPHRTNTRLRSIVHEAQPTVALTTSAIAAKAEVLKLAGAELRGLRWTATETVPGEWAEEWRPPALTADSLAFLQYTSGSTSEPKGVMVTHGNLLQNEQLIAEACGHSAATVFVGWLPLYHDMGLIGNVLQPLFLGGRCVLMAPQAFLQSPVRWLEAISRYRATTSGGPNFAYDLCALRIGAARRAALDLSSWSVAFNGAEPVRAETLERFAATFAECGFRRDAFFPCYGLAEATLLVTGADHRRAPATILLERQALAQNQVVPARAGAPGSRMLVSSGRQAGGQRVIVVDPESLRPCPAGQVGEIWVAGPSVAQGYWNRPEQSAALFGARPAGGSGNEEETGTFLRTGDLGFLYDGELYVTGRLKDLVIIRGQNHYPQDIELTAERSHPALLPGSAAAFSVESEGGERLFLVLERMPRSREAVGAIAPAVRWAVAAEHQIQVHTVVLVRAGTIPKTTSGKVRRGACRESLLAGHLEAIGRSVTEEELEEQVLEAPTQEALLGLDAESRYATLTDYLRGEVGRALRADVELLDPRQPLAALGLDSLAALELEQRIEQDLGVSLPIERLLDGASLQDLSTQLLNLLDGESAAPPALPSASSSPRSETEYPLSAMQRALWFEEKLSPGSAAYNVPFAARLEGEVDVPALERAFAALVGRHPALRTTLALRDGQPVQRIAPPSGTPVLHERQVAAGELAARLAEEARRPFDLEQGPLFRAELFCAGRERVLLIVVHHIVVDGWSLWVLLDDLRLFYDAVIAERPADFPLPAADYGDFVRWQGGLLSGAAGERLWDFWRTQLAGGTALDLPVDRLRAPGPAHTGAAHPLHLEKELVRGLRELARRTGTTLYTVLLGAFTVLLSRYCGRQEVVVGSPVSGRSRPEFLRSVGCFFNVVALRCDLAGDPTFEALLGRLRATLAATIAHQDYPSPTLAERLQARRQVSGVPFFEAQLIFQQIHPLAVSTSIVPGEGRLRLDLGSLVLDALPIAPLTARSPLELELVEAGDELIGQLRYSADLFEAATAKRLADHWENLLVAVAADAAHRLSDLPLLSSAEHELLLRSFSCTAAKYPAVGPVHQLFDAQVATAPDRVAAVDGDALITFAQLAHQADHLADFLIGIDT